MPANSSSNRMDNKRAIIDALIQGGEQSRAALAKRLQLSKPTVAEYVDSLLSSGMLLEAGEGEANEKGGRKPQLLSFNNTFRYIVSIDLSPRNPVFAIGDMPGTTLHKIRLTIGEMPDEGRADAVESTILKLLDMAGADKSTLGAIAISFPGIYNSEAKLMRANTQFRPWTTMGLDKKLAAAFGVPVIIKNDINACAVGELNMGCARGLDSMVYVSCGVGLGAGIIIDGKLHEGKSFAAGEMAFFTNGVLYDQNETLEHGVNIDGLLCQIAEDILSGKAPQSIISIAEQKGALLFEDIADAYLEGDEYIADKIRRIGAELGFAFSNMATLLDIQLIVFGGDYRVFFDILQPTIQAVIDRCTPIPPRLVLSELGDEAGLYGGFIHARSAVLASLDI